MNGAVILLPLYASCRGLGKMYFLTFTTLFTVISPLINWTGKEIQVITLKQLFTRPHVISR
jgi:hypothetical protein